MQIFVKECKNLSCQLPQSRFYKQMYQEWPELLLTGVIQQVQNSALHSSSVTRVKSKRSYDKWGKDGFFLFTVSKSIENSTSSMTSSMNINARASYVVCLLNISTTDKMLPLRTHNKYWNIFVASWRRRRRCLQQLSPRPPARKRRTRTRTRSRIWSSLMSSLGRRRLLKECRRRKSSSEFCDLGLLRPFSSRFYVFSL